LGFDQVPHAIGHLDEIQSVSVIFARTPHGYGPTAWSTYRAGAELIKCLSKICAISISVQIRADLLTAFLDHVVDHVQFARRGGGWC
jgi:hypothetical protein